ncbi:MAG: HslU--HslV peptidase ATPase subunit [Zetaproteobacteria bacterium CG12_big_fil_rev_8_21_14_0_65_55_1124]|nr:MAG: HslU--HslV peptidase ATPase subunit [Zetaproteobacteria bacterium CG08_land_8_20_14_0_20_55_17]PIW41933.1 MAG: HslU--HslV peptidase ATPase subunit [Zetaproteobacteria bacterium CG12_big_fil_rev_8_21_14_0_65_55_1124]PIY53551.1 MAG: HslU--HslV peptidase ATPase subunit [Zetaproteobacteria bacterium CG_4_10_14_0_8_um_filter_55_43]PIZ37421.1 MAG: HslU--HslV peptidase ATPase subunit [Zetaproteobacteria bacterium CG_4_10_14_0_2_um_filter_55_20]PJB81644.1 MAG: HslU--HslV peptidase ATPase subuni
MTPREIESELDRYIIGQSAAKRSVAIALRNRWRRKQVASPMREEITPKNILMIGPTGVGKTEIARRLAKLVRAPFVKVEATKYTEVGYVGRDVESIVRDLVDTAIKIVRDEHLLRVRVRAEEAAEERLLDILIPHPVKPSGPVAADAGKTGSDSRDKMRRKLRMGEMDERQVEIEVRGNAQMPMMQILGNQGGDGMDIKDMLDGLISPQEKRRRMSIRDALQYLQQEEADRLLDMDRVKEEAIERAENDGIVFLDEMDKITHRTGNNGDVSREGVQRDLLPLVEGTTVNTRNGQVNTDHILFIASGAFHLAKPSDLIPELQGRFPIRVALDALGENEFRRILTEPENALTRQYVALMATEGMQVEFTEDGICELARLAVLVNEQTENIGARRLHTLLERVLEEASFDAPDRQDKQLIIDKDYVQKRLSSLTQNEDLSRYIL